MSDPTHAAERVVIALGGNAIAPAHEAGTAPQQISNITRAMALVAELVAQGFDVLLTHGNGPQVGNLVIKNELARDVVPAMPLDWCVAQTQATIGSAMATALETELGAREVARAVAPVISRVLVDADDPAFAHPSKPIGPFIAEEGEVERRRADTGQDWARVDTRGWRRVVPSPEPRELLDFEAVRILLSAGAVVIACGGGGIPMTRDGAGQLHGVEAVIDKDLAGAMLARQTGANRFVICTDVPGVATGFGTDDERWLGAVEVGELRALQRQGEFAAGSMGPKVEAACRFVEETGGVGAIGALDAVAATVRGEAGTQVRGGRR